MADRECKMCGSSDGAQYYEDTGLIHCFVCEKTYKGDEGDNSVSKEQFKNETLSGTEEITSKIRGISPEVFKQFSYFRGTTGEHVANMYNKDGVVVAQKSRYKDKTFSWKGKTKEAVPFGMHLWRSGGKRITITEGELDCLSIAEALGGKYPVISISNGAQAAKKDLTKHMEYLNTFDEVVLWFDADEHGIKAVQEVSSLFPPGRVYTVQAGEYKDANEILTKAGKAGVLKAYYETRKYTPSGIVNANEGGFDGFMEDKGSNEVYDTTFGGVTISRGAITTFVSGSGMGKSTITKEIGHHLLVESGLSIGHVALEENNSVSVRAYLGIELNDSIVAKSKWKEFKEEPKNIEKIKTAYKKVVEPGKLFLYNHFGSLDSDDLLNKLRYLAVGGGCQVIILDHISILISGMEDMGDNERRTIDIIMTRLRSFVEETGVALILVSHLKRLPGAKGHEDGEQVSLSHLRGSGSIAQLSDKVIGLEGNQQDEAHSNERVLRCLKDREEGEKVGILSTAEYFPDIGRLLPKEIEEFGDESMQDMQEGERDF